MMDTVILCADQDKWPDLFTRFTQETSVLLKDGSTLQNALDDLKPNQISAGWFLFNKASELTQDNITSFYRVFVPLGKMSIKFQEPASNDEIDKIETQLILCGFVVEKIDNGHLLVVKQSFKPATLPTKAPEEVKPAIKTAFSEIIKDGGNKEIIAEDNLLKDDFAVKKPKEDAGCGPTVRKACKNCTCGRAK